LHDAFDRANSSERGDKPKKKRPTTCSESQNIRLRQKKVQHAACRRSSGFLPPAATFSARRVILPKTPLLDSIPRDLRAADTTPT